MGQEQGVRLWRSEVCGVRQLEGRRGATLLPPEGQRLLVRLRLAGPPLVLDRCNSVHVTSLTQLRIICPFYKQVTNCLIQHIKINGNFLTTFTSSVVEENQT